MTVLWHVPRKKSISLEPRIIISKRFIALNAAFIKAHFAAVIYAKVGYDPDVNKLYICPVEKHDEHAMKIIINEKTTHRYINASRIFKKFTIPKGEYKFTWDEPTKCFIVDIQNDKVK